VNRENFFAVPVVALISVAARHRLEWRDADGIAGDGPRAQKVA
jgi:hypothetical protein